MIDRPKKINLIHVARSKYSKKKIYKKIHKRKPQHAFNTFFKKFKNRQFTDEKSPFSTRGTPVSWKFPGSSENISNI